jgi:hypothetical protein
MNETLLAEKLLHVVLAVADRVKMVLMPWSSGDSANCPTSSWAIPWARRRVNPDYFNPSYGAG